jgi:Spy/CpxP family protein refolding chaperone
MGPSRTEKDRLMRTFLLASALAGTVLGVGAASAASPNVPAALRDGGACFEQARVFDRTL